MLLRALHKSVLFTEIVFFFFKCAVDTGLLYKKKKEKRAKKSRRRHRHKRVRSRRLHSSSVEHTVEQETRDGSPDVQISSRKRSAGTSFWLHDINY